MEGNDYCGDLTKLNEVVDIKEVQDNWVVGRSGDYWFEMKCFRETSSFGINGGRISKLHIKHKRKSVVQYDRDWGMKPERAHKKFCNKLVEAME